MERVQIEIDGSYGEGGGQIVRTACSFAAVTGKRCRIFNIRQARRTPGLQPQHLASVRALAQICSGQLHGDEIGSRELAFTPHQITTPYLRVNVATAASITLMLQALLPAVLALRAVTTIQFEGGGTDTSRAPTLDYFRHVFLWFLRRIGVDAEVEMIRRGYYPRGGAAIRMKVVARKLDRLELVDRGPLRHVTLFSLASPVLEKRKVAERQITGALGALDSLRVPIRSELEYDLSFSVGSALCIVAEFANTVIGSNSLGAVGKRAEEVGKEAAGDFLREFRSSACLDRHMADQILPYLALGGYSSSATVSEVTSHCRTNMWVIENFLDGRFQVRDHTIVWTTS